MKGPRRALALCVVLEAVSNLPDALGFGGLELAQQVLDLPSVVALGLGLKTVMIVSIVDPQIHVDLDLA